MAVTLKRPILIGGLGLAFGAYAWESMALSVVDADSLLLWGTVLAGSTAWWMGRKSKSVPSLSVSPLNEPLTKQQIEQAFESAGATIERFRVEATASALAVGTIDQTVAQFQDGLATIRTGLDRTNLRVVVTGDKGTGKTQLTQWVDHEWLPSQDALNIGASDRVWTIQVTDEADDANLLSHVGKDTTASKTLPASLVDADLVLFLVTGDMTETQFQQVKVLAEKCCRVCVVFSQADRYLPNERSQILQKLQQHMAKIPAYPINVIETAIAPAPIKVRTHGDDGTVTERLEAPNSDVERLSHHLHHVLIEQRDQLLLSTALCQTQALQSGVQAQLNHLRRDRAMPVIEEYQWIAAAAAFANPVPSLDLVATAAITTQMVVDIGAVYNLNFSVEQAKKTAGAVAELIVKLGLVELASQALSPLLKSHVLTYAAGGAIQGLSAAYLTHVAGLSLICFLEEQSANPTHTETSPLSMDRLKSHIQRVFDQNQRGDFLKALVQKGASRLMTPSMP
ncbi:MAG: YcjF family protein [Cyanobacteria bacterium P01_E01_bin.6]